MEFKEILRTLRKQRNLSQSQLGQILNYGYTAISNYENGRNEPSLSDIKKIASFFHVSIDYLVGTSSIENASEMEILSPPLRRLVTLYPSLNEQQQYLINSYIDIFLSVTSPEA